MVVDQDHRNHHEQRRRDALARDVRDHEREMVFIQHKEVVEVTADLARRRHTGVESEVAALREGRKDARQHVVLDPCGDVELRTDAFGLCGDACEVVNIGAQGLCHLVEACSKIADLIVAQDLCLPIQISAGDDIRVLLQFRERMRDLLCKQMHSHSCSRDDSEQECQERHLRIANVMVQAGERKKDALLRHRDAKRPAVGAHGRMGVVGSVFGEIDARCVRTDLRLGKLVAVGAVVERGVFDAARVGDHLARAVHQKGVGSLRQ